MNDRRKSARLSLKSSPCSGSSLSKPNLIEGSPKPSSALNFANFSSSSPQTSSPSKLNKSNSKLSQIPPKQQIKNVVKRSPKVITTILNTEINKEKKTAIRNKKTKTSYNKSKKKSSSKTNHNSRKKSKRNTVKQSSPPNTIRRILRPPSVDSPLSPTDSPSAAHSLLTITSSTPTTSSSLNNLILHTPNNRQPNVLLNASHNTTNAANVSFISNVETLLRNNNIPLNFDNTLIPTINPLSDINIHDLKFQLKKATVKFEKACRQLIMLDQHINDLQNSYSNSLENDRKTFKIVYRMQLATLEGTHNAYIEYIERQVEKIKKLKRLLFNENATQNLNNSFNNTITTIGPLPAVSNISANANISSSSGMDAL